MLFIERSTFRISILFLLVKYVYLLLKCCFGVIWLIHWECSIE